MLHDFSFKIKDKLFKFLKQNLIKNKNDILLFKKMGFKIAFCGKMASGKTTICEIIKEQYPSAKILNFAGPIKEIATNYFGMTEKNRELLIKIGQFGRSIDSDIWIKNMLKESCKHDYVLCDDLRQYNEHKCLKREGWFLIRLDVSPELQKQRLINKYGEGEAINHMAFSNDVSETEAINLPDDQYDAILKMDNYATSDALKEKIISLIFLKLLLA